MSTILVLTTKHGSFVVARCDWEITIEWAMKVDPKSWFTVVEVPVR